MPPGRAASPGLRRARPSATSRCCLHPGGTVLQHGPGRVPRPSAAVLDPGLRPATTRCSWDPVLPCGGHPPPILPGLPQAELPLPIPPELQVGGRPPPMPPGLRRARPPATSRCCVHPGLSPAWVDPPPMPPGRVPRPSAAVLDPGLRPATTRCSWDPVLPCGGRPPPSLVPGPGRPASAGRDSSGCLPRPSAVAARVRLAVPARPALASGPACSRGLPRAGVPRVLAVLCSGMWGLPLPILPGRGRSARAGGLPAASAPDPLAELS